MSFAEQVPGDKEGSKVPYREFPTPHPRKESEISYFDLEPRRDSSDASESSFRQGVASPEKGPELARPGYFARTHSDSQMQSPNKWMNPSESRKLEEMRPSLSQGLSFTSPDLAEESEEEEEEEEEKPVRPPLEFDPNLSYKEKVQCLQQRSREIVEHFEGEWFSTVIYSSL